MIAKIDSIFLAPNFSFDFLNRISIVVFRISLAPFPKIDPQASKPIIFHASLDEPDLGKSQSKLALIKENPCSCKASSESSSQHGTEDFPLGQFMRFLKHLKLKKLLAKIKDLRDPEKIEYSIEIILMWVLSVFFFRCESTNALQTAFEKLPMQKRNTLWNFFGLDPEKRKLPHRTVVTDCLAIISQDEINQLLEKLFKWALKSKIFYNHMEKLLPDLTYYLACDGVWVHKYTQPHSVDEEGKNSCPYCLPRVSNRGKKMKPHIGCMHL